MTPDKKIAKCITDNPEQGFGMLVREYQRPVYWHIRRMVVSHDDAQDVVQETFLRVFKAFGTYRTDMPLRTWLFSIATNECLRLLGSRKGKIMASLDDATPELLGVESDAYFDYSDELSVKMQRAIHSLPIKQQLAFNFRYYDELSYREIAVITQSTEANVKANYHIAKEKITDCMKKHIVI